MKLTIVGAGRAAWTFASIATATGRGVTLISRGVVSDAFRTLELQSRPLAPESFPDAELLLFALSDDAIEATYQEYGHHIPPTAHVFHPSGSLSSELFTHHPNRFSLHPLCSLPAVGNLPASFQKTLVTWEGSASTRAIAESITREGDGELRAIETRLKPLYHAAAVFGSNYVAASLAACRQLLQHAGVEEADEAVERLALSAIRNWKEQAGAARYTGPLARGDIEVVRAHLDALARHPLHQDAYRAMAEILLEEITGSAEWDTAAIAEVIRRNRQS